MTSNYDILIIIAFFAGIALVIAWIVLPFAIIGTKPLLRQLLHEVQRTNDLLRQLKQQAGHDQSS